MSFKSVLSIFSISLAYVLQKKNNKNLVRAADKEVAT